MAFSMKYEEFLALSKDSCNKYLKWSELEVETVHQLLHAEFMESSFYNGGTSEDNMSSVLTLRKGDEDYKTFNVWGAACVTRELLKKLPLDFKSNVYLITSQGKVKSPRTQRWYNSGKILVVDRMTWQSKYVTVSNSWQQPQTKEKVKTPAGNERLDAVLTNAPRKNLSYRSRVNTECDGGRLTSNSVCIIMY